MKTKPEEELFVWDDACTDSVTLAQMLGFDSMDASTETEKKDDVASWLPSPDLPAVLSPPPSPPAFPVFPSVDPSVLPPPPPRITHSRKRKHESPNSHVPRTQRCRSTFSYKFRNAEEEALYRLHAVDCDAKSTKLNGLVRACFARFGDAWVTWDSIKEIAAEVGYSRSNNLFRTTWALTVSRYGENSDGVQNNEVFGLNFPYWIADTRVPLKRGEKGKTLLRLAPEFFQCPPSHVNQ